MGTPKGHEKREVPIPRFLVDQIAEHIRGKAPDNLVFAGLRGGGALRGPTFRRAAVSSLASRWVKNRTHWTTGGRSFVRKPGLAVLKPHPTGRVRQPLRGQELWERAAPGRLGRVYQVSSPAYQRISAPDDTRPQGHLFNDHLDDVADRLDAAAHALRRLEQLDARQRQITADLTRRFRRSCGSNESEAVCT